jgi:hypothetical protein
MVSTHKTKELASKYVLSQEDRTKLLEEKIKRAEHYIRVLADTAKQLERYQRR